MKSSLFIYGNLFIVLYGSPPPHGLFLGNFSLSIIIVFKPFSAKFFAAVEPAGPAPTTTTSYSISLTSLILNNM